MRPPRRRGASPGRAVAAVRRRQSLLGGQMLREIVVEEETPSDFRTTFRLCVDGNVIAENVTELETQFLISEMLERIPSLRVVAKRRRQAARKRIARREPGGDIKMAAAYEDNFGFWFIDGPEERTFFEHVKRKSLSAICMRCERSVRLMPPKTLCATCVSSLEYGAPTAISEYGDAEPKTGPMGTGAAMPAGSTEHPRRPSRTRLPRTPRKREPKRPNKGDPHDRAA